MKQALIHLKPRFLKPDSGSSWPRKQRGLGTRGQVKSRVKLLLPPVTLERIE